MLRGRRCRGRWRSLRPLKRARRCSLKRARLGLGPDGVTPGASHFHRTIEDPKSARLVEVVVSVLTPHSAPTPETVRSTFERALGRDEVVVYMGHARYGTGPDFDPKPSGRGNFVIDRNGGPRGRPHPPLSTSLARAPQSMLPGFFTRPWH